MCISSYKLKKVSEIEEVTDCTLCFTISCCLICIVIVWVSSAVPLCIYVFTGQSCVPVAMWPILLGIFVFFIFGCLYIVGFCAWFTFTLCVIPTYKILKVLIKRENTVEIIAEESIL